jgi:hypothetical protein
VLQRRRFVCLFLHSQHISHLADTSTGRLSGNGSAVLLMPCQGNYPMLVFIHDISYQRIDAKDRRRCGTNAISGSGITNVWHSYGTRHMSRGCVVNVVSLGARMASWRHCSTEGGCAHWGCCDRAGRCASWIVHLPDAESGARCYARDDGHPICPDTIRESAIIQGIELWKRYILLR